MSADDSFLDEMERASTNYPIDYDRDRYAERDPRDDGRLDRSAWDDDFYDEVRRAREEEADQEHAARWLEAWDRLAPLGIVGPEDRDVTLRELERLASYLS